MTCEAGWDRLDMTSQPWVSMEGVLCAGWSWPAGNWDAAARFPTFTRAIRHRRAPLQPAGLSQCDEKTLQRWLADEMRFPPYTYGSDFLVHHDARGVGVLGAVERESLRGFRKGFTRALPKDKERELHSFNLEDEGRSAVGNSFNCASLAVVLAELLGQKAKGFALRTFRKFIECYEKEQRTYRLASDGS